MHNIELLWVWTVALATELFNMSTCPLWGHRTGTSFLPTTTQSSLPTPPLALVNCNFFLFTKMKLRLKVPCFDMVEVIQLKLKMVLKALTKWGLSRSVPSRSPGSGVPLHKGTTLKKRRPDLNQVQFMVTELFDQTSYVTHRYSKPVT